MPEIISIPDSIGGIPLQPEKKTLINILYKGILNVFNILNYTIKVTNILRNFVSLYENLR